jgi:sec-independent protein translocase protein TatC
MPEAPPTPAQPEPPASAPPPQPPTLADRLRGKPDGEGARMGFLEHLMELRRRLWICALTAVTCMAFALYYSTEVFEILRRPLDDVNLAYRGDPVFKELLKSRSLPENLPVVELTTVDPMSIMMTVLWLGVYAGLLFSSPMLVYQAWAFIAPGLRQSEKRVIGPVLWVGILFFVAGCALAYYVLFPISLQFLVWLAVDIKARPLYTVESYMSLLLSMMGVTGLACETPLVVAIFARLRLIKPSYLTRFWRPIVFGGFVAGAAISPGSDLLLMGLFTLLLLSLYFLSILAAYVFYPKEQPK